MPNERYRQRLQVKHRVALSFGRSKRALDIWFARRVLSVERFADKALSLVKAKGSLSTVGLTTLTGFS